MSPAYLLDANALIALVISDHEHHDVVARWAAGIGEFALCPIVEGALARFLVRIGENPATAAAILARLHAVPQCSFWPDSVSYAAVPLTHVVGHRQVTDAYLAALATSHGARLATLDHALVEALPTKTELIR